ncbi:uncharacterized protein PV06_06399 [Exophiala oligosperma]|uniref:Reverse transcriptase domain-containing protein n=1 Tax=Exophiala oligosperma TaxID=215243 RepID=A0A0D2DKG1_9EURO|nr:uncharacterized protein PV06_06399 [Exophiala oligosperma]KIW42895.1 hypothetical protein PV06_06399 [Exophiala oligosperma]
MSSSVVTDTLHSVTSTKIEELKRQHELFERFKSQTLRKLEVNDNKLDRTRELLYDACRDDGIRLIEDDALSKVNPTRRQNQQLLLRQAEKDTAIPAHVIEDIHTDVLKHFDHKSLRYEHAQFFSKLVTEWISCSEGSSANLSSEDIIGESSFQTVGRREMHEQREQWESIVFENSAIDTSRVTSYLHGLFNSNKVVSNAFKGFESATREKADVFWRSTRLFDPETLKRDIEGLLRTDLLSEEKAATLKSFQSNKDVLQEVSDVLTMRMESLDMWQWTTVEGAIPVQQRRQLNGKYRVFMDEDILDALLLHIIGMKWAVYFRHQFVAFFRSHAWKTTGLTIPKADQDRRNFYLGKDSSGSATIAAIRLQQYADDYFATQLPMNEHEGTRGYGDEDDEENSSSRKSPMEIKQSLLHLVITEAVVARHLHPGKSHAVIRSDFHWFGPSLPHDTIFTVLEYFGMSDKWLKFFRKFLQAPTRFVQDGLQGEVKVRRAGVPMSHVLSDVFGELILFVMDFAVNQATKGGNLYRLHDDFWFWGSEDLCVRGWETMTEFASIMGVKFNDDKTGSVVFPHDQAELGSDYLSSDEDEIRSADKVQRLPAGEVRWGFLRLDGKSARFVIDQDLVSDHITELKLQLAHCKSIFSWVQAYNAYLARFFNNNFGKPSYAFGRQHVDDMIDTFARVQASLFPEENVSHYLSRIAQERFKTGDIPDGVWYWPARMGGLELRNPMVRLYGMRETLRRTPGKIMATSLEEEELLYETTKAQFEQKTSLELRHACMAAGLNPATLDEHFMTKAEFLKYREECSKPLGDAYKTLLSSPEQFEIQATAEMISWLRDLPISSRSSKATSGITRYFGKMDPYWKWVLAVYGSDIVKKYGSLQIVNEKQVPLGVVSLMQSGKVRWQG